MNQNKILLESRLKLFQVIMLACKETGLCPMSTEDVWFKTAKIILKKHPEITGNFLELCSYKKQYKQQLDEIAAFLEQYPYGKKLTREGYQEYLNSMMFILLFMQDELKYALEHDKPKIFFYKKPSRQISPSYKAYYQVGHSVLNIGSRRISDHDMRNHQRPFI